jgi:hypothetical protein
MTGVRSADIHQSQQQWRSVRGALKEHRHELSVAAGELYQDVARVEGTGLLCRRAWLPDAPIELDDLRLGWVDNARPPPVAASSAESLPVRSLNDAGEPFDTYADAISVLDRPALFENRSTYRMLDTDLSFPGGRMDLTIGRYFDSISVGEALAHEFAAAMREHGKVRDMGHLPLRSAIGDPCDLSRWPASVAITTVTVRHTRAGDATFLLHWRDPAKVTHAAGMYQVMPVGIFQPADDSPASVRHDLNLWHSMVREFSEELLGGTEDYARFGSPVEYEQWDFYRRLTGARQVGKLRVSILGLGVDPLTLVTDILTVAVFDADVFDDVFDRLVTVNSEGLVVNDDGADGFALTEESVGKFTGGSQPMQAAGAAVLRLTWKHRRSLSLFA